MSSVAEHLKLAIHFENTTALVPIFDTERLIQATGDMLPWYTGKACEHVSHSHTNMAVFDSPWEASDAFELDRSPLVAAWVENDHLGFEVTYSFKGIIRKFGPDYLIRLTNRKMLVLEVTPSTRTAGSAFGHPTFLASRAIFTKSSRGMEIRSLLRGEMGNGQQYFKFPGERNCTDESFMGQGTWGTRLKQDRQPKIQNFQADSFFQ